jgi:hypothetical protein
MTVYIAFMIARIAKASGLMMLDGQQQPMKSMVWTNPSRL